MYRALSYVGLVMISLGLWECNFPTPIGEDIVRNEVLDVVFIDTIDLRMSTVISDSVVTSNTDRHLTGAYEDDEIGRIASGALFRLTLDSLEFPDEDAQYISTEFELFYDGYFHYDTSQDFTLEVYPLVEELELGDDGFLYNTSDFNYMENNRLGVLTFEPRPSGSRTISVPINDEFGRAIFELAVAEETDDFTEIFEDDYPGLALVADTSSTSSFLGFSVNSRLIINYRLSGEDYEMIFPSNGLRYNKINNDRSTSLLNGLATREADVSSLETNHRSFLNNSVGMSIKVEIPFLRDIREVLNDNFITEATLVLKPVKDTYGDLRPLPTNLIFYEVDKLNRVEQILDIEGALDVDAEFKEDTQYRVLITDFIQQKIDEDELNEDAILISGNSGDIGNTVDQLILGDTFNEYDVSLELFILDYIIDNQ